jgi:hypothetical protein
MASVYSTELYSGAISASGVTDLYTVPANSTLVVRDITVLAESAGANIALLEKVGGAPIWFGSSITANTYFHQEGRWVFDAGEVLAADLGSGVWAFHLSGYVLTN